jgi:LPS sulfotransferase NodH
MSSRIQSPVFVVGSARSGNTLLYHILLASGLFPPYRSEPVVFDLLVPRSGDLRRRANRERLLKIWVQSKQFRVSGIDPDVFADKVLSNCKSGGDFLRLMMDSVAKRHACKRWAVWGPDNLLHMDLIKREIPDALFLHVIRDGRDVAYSLARSGFIRPLPWGRKGGLLVSGSHWMWKTKRGRRLGRRLADDYLEIRYENLVRDPEAALARVSAFIGEELPYQSIRDSTLGTIGKPNTSFQEEIARGFDPVGRWRKNLTEAEVEKLEALLERFLEELDYPLQSSTRSWRTVVGMRAFDLFFRNVFSVKEWARTHTPLGRFVDAGRLVLGT